MSATEPKPERAPEPSPAVEPSPAQPIDRSVDPVHVAVLIACALGLIAIALRYFGAGS